MQRNHTVRFRVLSPVSHGALDAKGTDTVMALRRTPVWNAETNAIVRIPCVSGNALRGRVRRELMRGLFRTLGIGRETPGFDRAYSFAVNGGYLDSHDATINPDKIRRVREACPPLSLLGAAMGSWMLQGRVSVGILWPVTDLTGRLGLTSGVQPAAHAEVEAEHHHARLPDRSEASGAKPMPHGTEVIVAGSRLESEVRFSPEATEIEIAAFVWGLRAVGDLGGKSAGGLGRVRLDCALPSTVPYMRWLESEEAKLAAARALLGEDE